MEPISALSVPKENQNLDVVLPFFNFVLNFFMKFTEFLVHLFAGLIWQ